MSSFSAPSGRQQIKRASVRDIFPKTNSQKRHSGYFSEPNLLTKINERRPQAATRKIGNGKRNLEQSVRISRRQRDRLSSFRSPLPSRLPFPLAAPFPQRLTRTEKCRRGGKGTEGPFYGGRDAVRACEEYGRGGGFGLRRTDGSRKKTSSKIGRRSFSEMEQSPSWCRSLR
ncbi:hypothetical protein GWI33_018515 [Rhynchophorus ferrugineus]|uniref:Uncharacterized protein n=1 Tax=Rhynchophorus ferrugineus TaxID=354439 RepID=A0A834M560_RHYFE|nr:hypothetical protein GWI33_018515 [Rhynchophorus ferrugineus]